MVLTKSLRGKRPPVKATVRRSQLISTYGVGAVLPVESESFVVAGLDNWRPGEDDRVDEPRLCSILGVSKLYAPPGGESGSMVPIARFPEFVYCPNCNRLDKIWRLADKVSDRYVNKCKHCVTARLVPSRFVGCCVRGHMQDFPYRFWVHRGGDSDQSGSHALRITTDSANSTLAGITVSCSCGMRRTLEGALGSGSFGTKCSGSSPWLDGDREECDEKLVGLQRGASNVWFADVRSALTVDRNETDVERVLREILPDLRGIEVDDVAAMIRILGRKHGVDPDALIAAYREHGETDNPEDAVARLRGDEYEALGREHPERDGSETFVCLPAEMAAPDKPADRFDLVSKVTRLREVRALRGFARVTAVSDSLQTPTAALSRTRVDWLPAIEVLGEGVFLRVAEGRLAEWERTEFASGRAEAVTRSIQRAAGAKAGEAEPVTPRFLMMHSLSHAILNELALDTGYPASSIRERVYAGEGQSGILLYTATADAAGSLGGLCAQGTAANLAEIVRSAADRAQWCSADPVCLESMATGAGASNLAACHSCLLVPEVSCEHQNRMLDRGCLVGTSDAPTAGFLVD